MPDFLKELSERVLVFDGAFGTWVQDRDLSAEDFGGPDLEGCNEYLVITRPDLVAEMHAEYFDAGVDAVETATFGAFSFVLAEYGLEAEVDAINEAAARIAREVADRFTAAQPDKPRFVIGSIGPGTKLPTLGHIAFVDLRDAYIQQIRALLRGGIDVVLIETVYDLLQAKAAIIAARHAMKAEGRTVPIMVQVTMETTGRMLVGSEIGAALTALEALGPDVIGLNCATGPSEMTEHLRVLSSQSRTYLSCLPNAGLPSVVDGHTHYDLTPEGLADAHERFVSEFGLNIVGGCCGTTPAHLRAVVERLGRRAPTARTVAPEPGCSSIYSPVPWDQTPAYLAIGERSNANGSKAFREAMLDADWDTCVQIGKDQIREGAHVVDLCVDYVGRDGTADMHELAARFATNVALPVVLDSTEPEVLEAGLQHLGGKAILNSANLEDGEAEGSRGDRVFRLAKEYGAAVICLTIDEEGQARDVDWKLRVAHRLYDLAINRYGLEPTDLIFDVLTFPLSAGTEDLRGDGIATIEAIRRVKAELPGASTVLGLSNVSFGLRPAARHALNSVFLNECRDAGLDAAIVHAARIVPIHLIDERVREVCLDLIYDRRREGYDPLQELLHLFEGVDASAIQKEDRSDWSIERRLGARIIDGDRDGLEADLETALATYPALTIVNEMLLEGMKTVGELFGSGQMQLPFVLQSAETMKQAVAYLEPHMEKADTGGKGTIVLGTVKGDVHDIGKNLVDIILTNNGYTVHNIGIKVPIHEFVEKAVSLNADAIGMSGLLVKSTLIMRDNLLELNERGLSGLPVLLGGAALTRNYVEHDLRSQYDGAVFYGRDAFEGLATMDSVMNAKRAGTPLTEIMGSARSSETRGMSRRQKHAEGLVVSPTGIRSAVAADAPVFTPPFVGTRVAKGISLDEILGFLNETALFRNQWQYRPEKLANGSSETDDQFKERIRPILSEQLAAAKAEGWLQPSVTWGYFPANAEGNDLVIWEDESRSKERTRFQFPRQAQEPHLCISDFFREIGGAASDVTGDVDYAAFQVVTRGNAATEVERAQFERNEYGQYLLTHGLAIEMTEALAELWHKRIREEWGFVAEDGPSLAGLFRQQYRGSRYSWGYPACPDLDDQAKLADLLDLDAIGVSLTEEFMLDPEQSTSAIIVPHPEAKYFLV
ncbi:MAG: methionine synthase [Acidimicrobiia bacterium]